MQNPKIMLQWQERLLLCQTFATCSYPEKVFGTRFWAIMTNFVSKFPNFRCHGNRGWSDVNSNDTGKLLDLENPLFGATFVALFLVLAEFQPFFCQNSQIFVTMATGVVSCIFNNTIKLLDLENPRFVQHLWLYFLYQPSFSQFSVKIPKFSLPWQPGSV